jgi:proton-coupled amino acid transporter
MYDISANLNVVCVIGGASYLAFGEKTEILVFLNITPTPLFSFLQFLYVAAIMLTFPLALYPVVKITESKMFTHQHGHHHHSFKETWGKNTYRTVLVTCLGALSWTGNDKLERVVSLVGCLCW